MAIGNPYERAPEAPRASEWRDDALCAQVGSAPFFPGNAEGVSEAKAICASCTVQEQCLQYALGNQIMHGVWGGTSPNQRRAMLGSRAGSQEALRAESDASIAVLHAELQSVELVAERLGSTPRKITYALKRHRALSAEGAATRGD